MRDVLTISALAKRTGVSSKTLRYWESLGLLPKAARSHTGYRLFNSESVQRVEFIQKSKSVGLSLAEVAKVLKLAGSGGNPCPHVARWAEEKAELLGQQIRLFSALRRRLRQVHRIWSKKLPCPRVRSAEICCLIEDLPAPILTKGGEPDAKTMATRTSRAGGASA